MSLIVMAPVLRPFLVGLKVVLIVQFPPTATELPQVLLWLKSPLATMPVVLKGAVPVLLSITGRGTLLVPTGCLPKSRLVGDRLTVGAGAPVPVPVRLTVCGLSLALSLMVIAPVRVPVAVGVKVTLILQLAPAATALPQVLLWL